MKFFDQTSSFTPPSPRRIKLISSSVYINLNTVTCLHKRERERERSYHLYYFVSCCIITNRIAFIFNSAAKVDLKFGLRSTSLSNKNGTKRTALISSLEHKVS